MNTEISETCSYLKSKWISIPPSNSWLASCVECFVEQGYRNIRELRELVYQQWLLADLADVGVQVLPNNCITSDKCTLESRYAVQINYFVNVAVSFHKQIQKIRRPNVLKNLEVDSDLPPVSQRKEEPSARMLKMELTDGVVKVMGFEEEIIPFLREPFIPGMKAIIAGPVECRKGTLFLKSKNVIILGGEVDALLIPNATENILASALKMPLNPDPYSQTAFQGMDINSGTNVSTGTGENVTPLENECFDDDDEAMMMVAEVVENKIPDSSLTQPAPINSSLNSQHVSSGVVKLTNQSNIDNQPQQAFRSSHANLPGQSNQIVQNISNRNLESSTKQNTIVPDFNDINFDDDFDLLAAQSSTSRQTTAPNINVDSSTFKLYDSTKAVKSMKEITDLKQKLNECYNVKPTKPSKSKINEREDGKFLVDLNDSQSFLTRLSPERETPSSTDLTVDSLFSIEPFPPRKRPARVTTFTKIVKANNPKIKGDKWSVSAIVQAKGIDIDVLFESQVIDKIFGISAAQISKRDFVNDPAKKEELNKALKKSQLRFSKLECEMTFDFKDSISNPVIIDAVI